jgi:hypothetical protein
LYSKKGNQPSEYYLSEDAAIEEMDAELALVLVMANSYLHQYLPETIYNNVKGYFESATKQLEKNTLLQDWQERIRFVPTGYHNMNIDDFHMEKVKNIYTALLNNEQWINVYIEKKVHLSKQNIRLNHMVLSNMEISNILWQVRLLINIVSCVHLICSVLIMSNLLNSVLV